MILTGNVLYLTPPTQSCPVGLHKAPQDIFSCFVDVRSNGIFGEISFEQILKNDGDDKSAPSGTRVKGNNYL